VRAGISGQAKDGVQLMQLGLLRESVRAFGQGLKSNPDDLECLLGMSRALLSLNQERAAVPLLQRYLRLKPNQPEVVSHLAKLKAIRGDAKALDTLRILSEHEKAEYFEHLNYGAALLELGRLDEAEVALHRARQADPGSPYPLVSLGVIAQRRGKASDAVEAFRAAADLDERQAYPLLLIARSHVASNNFNAALDALNEGLRRNPKATDLHIERIKLCLALGATEQAFRAAGLFRQLEPTSPDAAHLHGLSSMLCGHESLARESLEAALVLAPTAHEPRLTLARLEQLAKNVARERELLEEAVTLAPSASAPVIDLSTFYLRHQEVPAAIALLQEALARDPTNTSLHLNLALALTTSDPARALEHAKVAATSDQPRIREQGERLAAKFTN